jgi:hypothetical protein
MAVNLPPLAAEGLNKPILSPLWSAAFSFSKCHAEKKVYALNYALQSIFNRGVGAFRTNRASVRPQVKSEDQWAYARVYAAINPTSKAHKIDKMFLVK